jgi:Xaa-Pro aminopeptidase
MRMPKTPIEALRARRAALSARLSTPALLAAGVAPSRNFRANPHRFRASSHFLYLVGRAIEGAALLLRDGRSVLYAEPPSAEDALWHGPRPSLAELCDQLGLDEVKPLGEIDADLGDLAAATATLPTQDARSCAWLGERLGRPIAPSAGDRLEGGDAALADAIISLRLIQDEAALPQLRHAAEVSARAHLAGMRATRVGVDEWHVLAAMLQVLRAEALDDAYGPIVTVHGEVLHASGYDHTVAAGDLLLADVGGETPEGWAADITRVWPVAGTFSPTQRAIYQLVLEAQRQAIAATMPGRRYRDVHEVAKRATVSGLCDLGILQGEVDGLLERGAAALFFPHGIGHLLGLDVHDMEDLGDRAGYAPGRQRSTAFGDAYLRLDRDLEPGMLVTIEPGFYQVPGILGDERYTSRVGADLRRDELARYADVRGIRIEDDVLVTAAGNEILTAAVPKDPDAVEAAMRG